MAANFKRLTKILENWPLDQNKVGRDLGQYLREYIQKVYKEGKLHENPQYWDRQYLSLQRIVDNEHAKKYPRVLQSSATGLTAEQCNFVLSNECLEQLEKEDQPFYKKILSWKKFSTKAQTSIPHIPVMLNEVLEYLKPESNNLILDMTFGAGGHSREILKCAPNARIVALDRDPIAHKYATGLSEEFPDQVTPLLGRFSELPHLLRSQGIAQNSVDGILFDFGCSSMQFDSELRGFSISKNAVLDMRMDGDRYPDEPTAADVLSAATEDELYRIIKCYGEEKDARKIARAIVEARYMFKRITTSNDLADIVESVLLDESRTDKLQRPSHVATKTFQALRIFVNNELNEINYGLLIAQKYLKIGGRLVTITFHSLEDTIVKRHMLGNLLENSANPMPLKYTSHTLNINRNIIDEIIDTNWKMLHKHVIIPRFDEVESNPRSRSAKLRAAVRVQ